MPKNATYLVRFDDLCPTMNWTVWSRLEPLLEELAINPILAIVPDNRDPHLEVERPNRDFWTRARAWQARRWTIGMHGYQHRYVTDQGGVIGLNRRSEFAGLSADEQEDKVRRSVAIFEREDVRPEVWVAPGHSFDRNTLAAVASVGIRIVSDGLALFPYVDRRGMTWIPQQLWRFRPLPVGVWTVCCHPNGWTDGRLAAFVENLRMYRRCIVDVRTIVDLYRGREERWWDRLTARVVLGGLRARKLARQGRLAMRETVRGRRRREDAAADE